jgi:hypothetical protein
MLLISGFADLLDPSDMFDVNQKLDSFDSCFAYRRTDDTL